MLIDYFLRGGWVMWPILAASIVALAVVINRLAHLLRTRGEPAELSREVLRLVDERRIADARTRCAQSRIPSAAVLEAGLSGWGLVQEEQERRMEQAASDQLAAAESLLPLLASMVAVLPMLGFLGTILGLIEAFGAWSAAGANVSIEALASGIEEAMITTAGGLLTSIPYVLAYNAFSASTARIARSLNSAASDLAGRHRTREADDAQAPAAVAVFSVGTGR
ncbi:MAG TPA: MotA/TolQ/ExbB proton channel family protein [Myxococcales bacterium]